MLTGINHITLTSGDISKSIDFYVLLGFKPHVRWDKGAYLSLNGLWLCLALDNVDKRSDYSHIALNIAEGNFKEFRAMLNENEVIEWKPNSSEGESIYLLDPSGHKLEIHVGDLESRLRQLKEKPYNDLEWL